MSDDENAEDDVEEITQREVLKAFAVLTGEHSVNTTAEIRGVVLEKMQDGEWWAVRDDDGDIADIVDFSSMRQAQDLISWCYQYALALDGDDVEEPEAPQRNRRELQ
jgi:hypothetical protein